MSKLIYVYHKNRTDSDEILRNKFLEINNEIVPDNIIPNPPNIYFKSNLCYAVINPVSTTKCIDDNLLLGLLNNNQEKWHELNSDRPDGTFVIIRSNNKFIETLTDPAGSRSVWYYFDSDKFIISTSQIAISKYLEDFQLNKKVIPWILSSGSLGPDNSWDKRVKKIKPNSTLRLDKENWNVTETVDEIKITSKINDYTKASKLLNRELNELFSNIKYDFSKWYLPLSGGYDSRAILLFLKKYNKEEITTVTWGTKESKKNPQTDSYIAKKLANKAGVKNLFFVSKKMEKDYDVVLDRFILSSEGCIDHISAYMDGLQLWKDLYNHGCEGIIRGDIPFASVKFNSEIEVRKTAGLLLCNDFELLKDYETWGYRKQKIPRNLKRKKNESYQAWIDRLYLQYRTPVITNSLSDIKYSYVEQSTPLLSKNILKIFCEFSDELREEKTIFKKIVEEINDDVSFSTKSSNEIMELVLRDPAFVDIMKRELTSEQALLFFPNEFLKNILNNLKNYKYIFFKPYKLIYRLKKRFGKNTRLKISYNLIAFRILIILRMQRAFDYKNK